MDRNTVIERSYWALAEENVKLRDQLSLEQGKRLNEQTPKPLAYEELQAVLRQEYRKTNRLYTEREQLRQQLADKTKYAAGIADDLLATATAHQELFEAVKEYLDASQARGSSASVSRYFDSRKKLLEVLEGGLNESTRRRHRDTPAEATRQSSHSAGGLGSADAADARVAPDAGRAEVLCKSGQLPGFGPDAEGRPGIADAA